MGQGIIPVSTALFEPHEPMVDGMSMTDKEHIALPQTLAEWHALLMLPEEYKVLEAKADAMYPLWLITVENDAIPVARGKKLPDIQLIMQQDYDSETDVLTVSLKQIEVYTPKQCVIWQREEQA
jgi:hypothetical protein